MTLQQLALVCTMPHLLQIFDQFYLTIPYNLLKSYVYE